MASKKKITEMLAAIKTVYPYYAKESGEIELLVNTWQMLLSEYSDQEVEQAFTKCLKKCKMPPTPADIVEQIESKEKTTPEEALDLWSEYVNALRKAEELTYYFPFTFVESNGKTQGENARDELKALFDNLSYPVKKYIGSVGMLTEKGKRFDFEELKYEKPGFLRDIVSIPKQNTKELPAGEWALLLEEA